MKIEREEHRRLLVREYQLQQDQFDEVLNKRAVDLRLSGKLYVAQYAGFDNVRGHVVLKLSTKYAIPRKREHLTGIIPDKQYLNPRDWGYTAYKNIRTNPQRICELIPVWFQLEPDDRVLIGFRGADVNFVEGLNRGTLIVLGPAEPPTEYLRNLIHLVDYSEHFPRFRETIEIDLNSETWLPTELENNSETSLQLAAELAIHRDIIIQGPPGTGKSYVIANLCADYLKQGRTVLVTSLTNTALMELAEKEGLKKLLDQGAVYKTNLTLDESRQLPKLRNGDDYDHKPGTILLATYYKVSNYAKTATGAQFDLAVAEEASQAFLATLGAIRYLGEKCVIIGDQCQLQPIRILKDTDLENPALVNAFNGLDSLANSNLIPSKHILTITFRLNPAATHLTNAFYNDRLISVQENRNEAPFNKLENITAFINPGVKLTKLALAPGVKAPANGLTVVASLLERLRQAAPSLEIAVLSFYVETVKELQKWVYSSIGYSDKIVIETVDRVQGLTVDICIYFIPNTGLSYSLNAHRFNVATSRAKLHTAIIAPDDLTISDINSPVYEYLRRLEGLS